MKQHRGTNPEVGLKNATTRIMFIDNVRWTMTILVLSMHAADTYSPFGNWYYVERKGDLGLATTLFFATYQSFLQSFFMALLFFVAGCFTHASLIRRGALGFVRERSVRLGLPIVLFVFGIGPITEYFVAHSWHTREPFAHEMMLYLARGRFVSGTGPLWFCAALLVFSASYAAIWALRPWPGAAPTAPISPFSLTVLVLAMSGVTFLVRVLVPRGTSILNMQLGDWPSYVGLFGLGILAGRRGWLSAVAPRFARLVAGTCLTCAALGWAPLLVVGGALRGNASYFAGGWHWQSWAMCVWESLVCVGMLFGVLDAFRTWFPRQGAFSRFMSENAFAVYVVHPPALIAIAIAMASIPLPPVPKFIVLWGLSTALCFGLAAPIARRIPLVGDWLR